MLDQEERWLTYAEAGQLLGISSEAARAMARRNHWPRRTPNKPGALAQVQVPDDRPIVRPRPGLNGGRPADARRTAGGYDHPDDAPTADNDRAVEAPDVIRSAVRALESAVEGLREQLTIANQRADRERDRADQAERRIEELLARRRQWWPWRR